jgi:hypothetical protein
MQIKAAVSVIAASLCASSAGAGVVVIPHETELVPLLLAPPVSPPSLAAHQDERAGGEYLASAPSGALAPVALPSADVLPEQSLLNALAGDGDIQPGISATSAPSLPHRHIGDADGANAVDDPVSVPLPPMVLPALGAMTLATIARRRLIPN